MASSSNAKLRKQLEKKLAELGKVRDGLSDLMDEVQQQYDTADSAMTSLREAIDKISELT